MGRSRIRLGTAAGAAVLALSVGLPPVEAQSAAGVSIVNTGVACPTAEFCFSPNSVTVSVGATVTWTNNSSAGHTVTASDSSWDAGNVAPGYSVTHTFAAPGTYHYLCTIHKDMTGTVQVNGSAPPAGTSAPHTSTPLPAAHTSTSTTHTATQSTPPATAAPSSATTPAPVADAGSGGSSPTASPDSGALAASAGSAGSSGGSGGLIAVIVVIVAALGGGSLFWLRRRSQAV